MITHRLRPNRSFNLNRYLDREMHPVNRPVAPRRLALLFRLDRWACRQLDRIDWMRIDILLGQVFAVGITGAAVYLIFIVLNAVTRGAFQVVR